MMHGLTNLKIFKLLYVPPAFTGRNSVFCPPQCIYVYCVDLKTNSDYITIEH